MRIPSVFQLFSLTIITKLAFAFTACGQAEPILADVDVEVFAEGLQQEKAITLLDVRTPEEWEEGYMDGAQLMNFFDENFQQSLGKLEKDQPVYVYCKGGGRSGKAARMMHEMGFTEVYNLEGGITAWKQEKGETNLVKP